MQTCSDFAVADFCRLYTILRLRNICGPCLTSPGDFQQCRAIRLFLWNCEPRSQPLPVFTVSKGVTRLALQLGSVDLARRWLANWNLAYLKRQASCRPVTLSPLTQGSGTLAYLSTPLDFAAGVGRVIRF